MIYWQIALGAIWVLTTVRTFYDSQSNGNPTWSALFGITIGRVAVLLVLYEAGAFSLVHG